jgi:tyrosine-protein phosphatase SIW14
LRPLRFAQVTDRLFRGGQPSPEHLEHLKAMGIDTIINLRRENSDLRLEEEAHARRLGLRFIHFPFYGIFGANDRFLHAILQAMANPDNGCVYIHCKRGRDRTSLLIALYRVIYEDWDPEEAWQREVLAYGFRETFWYRRLHSAYLRMVEAERASASA